MPADCRKSNVRALIGRGDKSDRRPGRGASWHPPLWGAADNSAIVITFDENDKEERSGQDQGCCGNDPGSAANSGGGRIPTIVITNHGPRGVIDDTPYNHYSLLRTTEAAFGIAEYLGHAADEGKGVVTMAPLFAVELLMRSWPTRARKRSRIEVIPMIDVMMFLLVFFVLISLNALPALGLRVALPYSSKPAHLEMTRRVTLTLTAGRRGISRWRKDQPRRSHRAAAAAGTRRQTHGDHLR